MSERLDNAIKFAVDIHHGQFDKGGNPYILHPLKLFHWAKQAGYDEDVQIVALLHDTVEDGAKDWDDRHRMMNQIQEMFGDYVAEMVDNLTKRRGESYDEYLKRVCLRSDSIRVKLLDLRHNSDIRRMKGITEKDFRRTQNYQRAYDKLNKRLIEMI